VDEQQEIVAELIERYVVPKRSLTGGSAERVDTRVLQAPPISKITRKKLELSVPNPLARSSHNRTE
jgi:hypothetical protein